MLEGNTEGERTVSENGWEWYKAEEQRRGIAGVIADVREGLFYVRSSRWLWVSILCLSVGSMGMAGPFRVSMPKLIMVFLLGGLLALSTNFLPLLVREVREME